MALPILYSLRNCPYAMRARLAIFKSQQPVALRDVVLTDKPAEMILASPKATVPILVLDELSASNEESGVGASTVVIDESLDIMLWALKAADPLNLLHRDNLDGVQSDKLSEMLVLINDFDVEFKVRLEAYKCAKRYHETTLTECRISCEEYIQRLEDRLTEHDFFILRARKFSRHRFTTIYSPICSHRAPMVFAITISKRAAVVK